MQLKQACTVLKKHLVLCARRSSSVNQYYIKSTDLSLCLCLFFFFLKKSFFWPQERRIAQQKEVLKKERETAEKIAARAYTQQYLAELLPAVFTSLRSHGYFYDPVEKGQPSSAAFLSSINFRSAFSLLAHEGTAALHRTQRHFIQPVTGSVTSSRWAY